MALEKKILLSICIPSFNRFDKLKKNLESIKKAKSDDFNVWVIDNCSDRNIRELDINDERIHLISRDEPVSAAVNGQESFSLYADGKYRLTCLDKDFIVGENLDFLLECLRNNPDITCGYCEQNSESNEVSFHIVEGELARQIFHCFHPSGYFFRRDVIERCYDIINSFSNIAKLINFPYFGDLIYAQGLVIGKEAVFSGRFVITESKEDAQKTPSYTYAKAKNNLFFLPEQRMKQFDVFVDYSSYLEIRKDILKKIVKRLMYDTMYNCTLGYKNIMNNSEICNHYFLQSKRIKKFKMIKYGSSFSLKILFKRFRILNPIEKLIELLKIWRGVFPQIIKSK